MVKKIEKVVKTEEKKTNTVVELREQIKKAREELFALKLENQQRKLKNTSSLTTKRKEIARMLTSLRAVQIINENI